MLLVGVSGFSVRVPSIDFKSVNWDAGDVQPPELSGAQPLRTQDYSEKTLSLPSMYLV